MHRNLALPLKETYHIPVAKLILLMDVQEHYHLLF